MMVAISFLSKINRINSFQRMILSENKFSHYAVCLAVSMLLILSLLTSCKKLEPVRILKVETGLITDISYHSCSVEGTILDISKNGIDQYGFCWAVTEDPTIENNKTQLGSKNSTGNFHGIITGLLQKTTYYIKAYATNSQGTAYGEQMSFRTTLNVTNSPVSDVDGNVYNTVTIGTQTWMAENLKTTKYNDNTPIPLVTNNVVWSGLSTPAYCWYNNNATAFLTTYGALYNWYVVDTAGNGGKNVCPTGWHTPDSTEWTTLTVYLGGENVAGGKLKEFGTFNWLSPNTGATDESGFTALPGGCRFYDGTFGDLSSEGCWWSSTKGSRGGAYYWYLFYSNSSMYRYSYETQSGFSVRCLKD